MDIPGFYPEEKVLKTFLETGDAQWRYEFNFFYFVKRGMVEDLNN
jgi:hypothetical protein